MQNRLLHRGFGIVVGLFLTSVLSLSFLHAAETKPVLTVSTANPETLYNIAEKIAALSGTLDAFEETAGPFKELKGCAPKNPIVFVLHAEGSEFKDPLLFLPITDINKVEIPGFEMILAQMKKESDGKYLLNSPAGAYILTQKKGYLVVSSESSEMPIPDDPAAFIKGLEAYSLGIRVDVENTSAEAVQTLLMPFQLMASMQGGEQAAQAFEQINHAVDVICKEARSLTFGLTMDPKTADSTFVSKMIAKKGSDSEKQLEFLKDAKTIFSGFLGNSSAVASFSSVSKGLKDSPDQLEMVESQIDQLIAGMLEQVEENAEEDEDVELAETVAASAKKILLETLALNKIDFAVSLGGDGTFVLGTSIAEGKELEKIGSLVMKRLEKMSTDKEQFADAVKKMKTNYAVAEGFQLSSFVYPLKELAAQDENFPKAFADKTFCVYWGLKDDAFVLLSGFNPQSEEQFKSAIAATKKPVATQGGSGFIAFQQLGKLMKDFQIEQASPESLRIVDALLQAGSDTKITLSQTVDKNVLQQEIFINGKFWEVIKKIAAGANGSESGSSDGKIREFK